MNTLEEVAENCIRLPAARQLMTMILPKRLQAFLTNRSRSRSIPRGTTPCIRKQRKVQSVYALTSHSEHRKSPCGLPTSITSSSWKNVQVETRTDIEHGRVCNEDSHSFPWVPSRKRVQSEPFSMQSSVKPSLDRAASPPLEYPLTHPPHTSSFRSISESIDIMEIASRSSIDEQIELLRMPESSYRTGGSQGSDYVDMTMLPRIGLFPDEESLWLYPPRDNDI